jgi:hypothetical protein
MKTALTALLLLTALSATGQDAPAPATSAAPNFWHRLGSGIKDSASRIGQEMTNPGATKGDAFRPLTPGANELLNMFPAAQSGEASLGHLAWPRVALTFEEYGEHKNCWVTRARIWTDSTSHHDERFEICRNSPVRITDDLGQTGYSMPNDLSARILEAAQTYPPVPTTGTVGTEGPNPPTALFMRNIPSGLIEAQHPVLNRIFIVTGFRSGIAGGGRDYRMWIAGYNPAGNKG